MTPRDLLAAFDVLAEAPGGTQRLRALVLELAVRGKLVPQDPRDEPASALLEHIAKEKARLVKEGKIRAPKPLPPVGKDEAPFEAPEGWAWCRLASLIELISGQHLAPDEYVDTPQGLPYLTGPADFGPVHPAPTRWTHERRAVARAGDILLTVKGAGIGKTNLLHVPEAAISRQLMALRPLLVLGSYLHLVVKQAAAVFQDLQVGIAIPGIGRDDVLQSHVALPPLSEQQRIVARVDELMGVLDRLEAARGARDAARVGLRDAALAALRDAPDAAAVEVAWARVAERMDELFTAPADVAPLRQTILQLAVRGKLVPQDPRDEPASALLDRIAAEKARLVNQGKLRPSKPLPLLSKDDVPFEVPDSWAATRLGTLIAGTDAGWSPKCEGDPTKNSVEWGVLRTTAVQPNSYEPIHHKALPSSLEPRPELEVQNGDLLVTRAGPWFRVGVAAYVEKTRPRLMLSDKIIRCTLLGKHVSGKWLALCLNTGPGAEYLRGQQSGMDAAQMNISQPRLHGTPILVPPLAEQQRIVAKVDELMAMCDQLEARLRAVHELQAAFAAAAVHHLDT